MRIKTLFSIPDGEKVTEKALRRVLISSICSILLCMTCLVSTTWAWFTVSIENTDNVIQIATVSETVTIKNTNSEETIEPADGVYHLENGSYSVKVQVTSNATGSDDLNKKKTPVYVLMAITYADTENDIAYYYFPFNGGAGEAERMMEIYSAPVTLRFSVTWMEPAAAVQIGDGAVIIGEKPAELAEMPTTVPEDTTEATEETTVPQTTEPATIPDEMIIPSTTTPTSEPDETTVPATESD